MQKQRRRMRMAVYIRTGEEDTTAEDFKYCEHMIFDDEDVIVEIYEGTEDRRFFVLVVIFYLNKRYDKASVEVRCRDPTLKRTLNK